MPKPVLQAMVLADQAYQDRATGKVIIAGTFSRVMFGGQVQAIPSPEDAERVRVTGPITRSGSPYLYLALVGVHGQVPLNLKFVDLEDASVLFEAEMTVTSTDPVAVAEFVLPLPLLPIIKPGVYSLDLLHDGEILGSWRVAGVNIDGNKEESQGEE